MTAADSPVLFHGVTKRFTKNRKPQGLETFTACQDLSFSVDEGEVVAIVGETGSGKSTTLGLLLGLLQPTAGTVRVVGADPCADFMALKGRIAIIFQEDRLLPWRTALENVTFGLEITSRGSKTSRKETATQWLRRVGLGDFVDAYPHELSGGMRQRVAIARAFALEPQVLIGDETFSALDEITAADIRQDLLSLIAETGRTTLFVTHSVVEAVDIAQRVLVFGRPAHVVGEVDIALRVARGEPKEALQGEVRQLLRRARELGIERTAQ